MEISRSIDAHLIIHSILIALETIHKSYCNLVESLVWIDQ